MTTPEQTLPERCRGLCARLGVRTPLLNAPMTGAAGPELAAAVSAAGGLGVLAGAFCTPDELAAGIGRVRERTSAPFAVGLRVPCRGSGESLARARKNARALEDLALELGLEASYAWGAVPDEKTFAEQLEVVLESEVPVLVMSFGGLREIYAEKLEARGVAVLGAATTLREAKVQRAAGAAAVIVQGVEAGGPRLNFEQPDTLSQTGLLSLIGPAARATGLPVIAAGGIATGAQWAASLVAGASGVMAGTAFLRTEESAAPAAHKAQLAYATDASTRLVRTFEGRLARVIVNGLVEALEQAQIAPGDYPEQCAVMRPILEAAGRAGRGDLMELAAGQGAAMAASGPAGAVVERLQRELQAALGASVFFARE